MEYSCYGNQITEIDRPEHEKAPPIVLNEETLKLVQRLYDLNLEIQGL